MLTVKQRKIIGFLFLALCFAYAIRPVFKESLFRHVDARCFYVNGVCWLSGKCPYHMDVYRGVWKESMKNDNFRKELSNDHPGATIHPPSLAIYTMPSAFFAWETGKYYYDFMNVIFLLAIIFFLTRLIKDLPSMRANVGQIEFVMGLGCLNTALQFTISHGQLSFLALTGALGAFYFSERKQFFIAGLFVVLASMKPHVALLFIIYLFIQQRDWRFFGWSSLLVGTTFIGVLIMGGDLNPIPEIVANYKLYAEFGPNAPSRMLGLTNLMAFLGISRTILISLGLAIVTVLALWFRKMNIAPNNHGTSEIWMSHKKEQGILAMALIFAVTALFMPLHMPDYTIFFTVVILLVVVRWDLARWLIPGIILVARPDNMVNVLSYVIEMPVSRFLIASLGAVYLTLTIAIIIWKLRTEVLEAIQH